MSETIMILSPDVRGQQVVERRDFSTPGDARRDFQPFGVLVEHRINDMDERFIAIEKPVSAGEQVTFQPAFALMFAEHFHHPASSGEEFVVGAALTFPLTLRDLKQRFQSVGKGLIRTEHAEIPLLIVHSRDVT
ncbi:MAG: hypothetical protein JWM11_3525, partial [Planctomycetaceae bacterium]|nr:hypothetical protein [Planctomycetaceae bacterium]